MIETTAGLEPHIDGIVQDCSKSIVNTLELPQSCTKPSTYLLRYVHTLFDLFW